MSKSFSLLVCVKLYSIYNYFVLDITVYINDINSVTNNIACSMTKQTYLLFPALQRRY